MGCQIKDKKKPPTMIAGGEIGALLDLFGE